MIGSLKWMKCGRQDGQLRLGSVGKSWQSGASTAGFTLIEILLVTTIVGILGSIVLIAINPQQRIQASFDAQRRSDLAQIRDALEAYAASHQGAYPSTGGAFTCNDCGASDMPASTFTADNWIPDLVASGAIKRLPQDPRHGQPSAGNCAGGSSYGYVYVSDGDNYKVMAYCTVTTGLNSDATQTPMSSSYCPTVPPYGADNLVASPAGVSELSKMVDPRRPLTGYAVYSEGFTCK